MLTSNMRNPTNISGDANSCNTKISIVVIITWESQHEFKSFVFIDGMAFHHM
jgi:hypothetical protein